jgi:hypothetical protein
MTRGMLVLVAAIGLAAPASAKPARVIIIRHAEKPEEGNELSLKGRERAAALVPYFLETPGLLKDMPLAAIYAQGPKKDGSSIRSIQTVKGLADARKLTIIDKYTRDEFPEMFAEIRKDPAYEGKTVLICWEHKAIPDIAKAFGADDAPDRWHGSAYDRTWIITFKPDGKLTFQNLPQKLMYGDSAE